MTTESISVLVSIVRDLGFPIATCGALFWYIVKQGERHREELAALTQTIENNTNIITKLYERMGGDPHV